MPGEKILVVDDEDVTVNVLRAYLERDGYRVVTAMDGREALRVAELEHPDLIVLDLMLPEISGWDVCRTLRQKSEVPIIMATARDEVTEKIVGLELGADDYITKPFDPKELVARVRAVLRRRTAMPVAQERISAGELEIQLTRHEVRLAGELVQLTPTEFELLRALAQAPGKVYSRLELLDIVQGEAYKGYERTIDSHMRNLRRKIERHPHDPKHVLTVFGVGYKFSIPDPQPKSKLHNGENRDA